MAILSNFLKTFPSVALYTPTISRRAAMPATPARAISLNGMPPIRRVAISIAPMNTALDPLPMRVSTQTMRIGAYIYMSLFWRSVFPYLSLFSLYPWMAHARYSTMATLTTSKTCIWKPAMLSVLHAPLILSASITPGILTCRASRESNTADSPNPSCESTLNRPIFLMLYRPNMSPSPIPTTTRCSLMKSILSLSPCLRSEVEENMARMEIMISRNTIIHTTLSPSILSMKPQNPFFRVPVFFLPFVPIS